MTDAPLAPSRPPLGLSIRSLLAADVTVLLRTPLVLLLNAAVPLIFVVATALGSKQRFGADPGLLIGLSITYGLMSAGMLGYATTVARDREAGVFQRLRITPTPTWAIMGSRIAVQLVSALVMSIVVLVVGSILHGVSYAAWQYLAVLGVALLGSATFLCIGQAVVGLFRSSTGVSAVARVLYILFILSGILGSTGVLGSGFQTFAAWTPVGALTNLFAVVFGATWTGDATVGIVAAPVYAIVFAIIGIRFFRWESR